MNSPSTAITLTYQVKFLGAVAEETASAAAKCVQDPIQWSAWVFGEKVDKLSQLTLCFQRTPTNNNAESQMHTIRCDSFMERGLPKRKDETKSEMLNGFLES